MEVIDVKVTVLKCNSIRLKISNYNVNNDRLLATDYKSGGHICVTVCSCGFLKIGPIK